MDYNFFNIEKDVKINSLFFKKNETKLSLNKTIGLTIDNPSLLNIFNLRANRKNSAFKLLMKKFFDIKISNITGNFSRKNESILLNIGPDEMLFITKDIQNDLIKKLDSHMKKIKCVMTDLTDHYQVINLHGDDVRWILSKGCPLNLDVKVFLPGHCAQTLLSRANIILFCSEKKSFTLICVSSFSEYVLEWIKESSEEHGYIFNNNT